ncbi:MAG: hypothetical protein H6619_01750 [Deltaproteobacteria bacterium]|nr:hypothetical protein [Deltaproteobacteria bacterium]
MKKILLFTSLVAIASTAFADVSVTFTTKDFGSGKQENQTMYIKGDNLAISEKNNIQQPDMIFKSTAKEAVAIDHSRREYFVMNKETMQKIGGQMSAAMKQMQAQMATMPPEQRRMMESMMSGKLGNMGAAQKAKIEVRKTGETDKIDGKPVVKYEIVKNGRKTTEYWVTPISNVKNGQQVYTAFSSLGSFMSDLIDSMKDFPLASSIETPFSEFTSINGIPVLTRQFDQNGKVTQETRFGEIVEAQFAMSSFEPPAGYKANNPTQF